MRGILVRSLTERGISFEHAYDIAEGVWRRVRDRALVTRQELAMLVRELAAGEERLEPRARNRRRTDALTVLGKDGRWPFNQARLQQSLLAAGVEPLVAFQAAVDIEQELRERGDVELTRDDIRALADRMLRRRDGVAAADRYLAWRSYQNEDERPLILLLGGTSGVGKSSLAVEVARRLGIGRVLSTDSIRDVMRMMLSDDLVPTLHVSSFEAHTALSGSTSWSGRDPVIDGFLEQSRTVCVGVRAVIDRAIVEGTSMVLDGVSLVPGLFDRRRAAGPTAPTSSSCSPRMHRPGVSPQTTSPPASKAAAPARPSATCENFSGDRARSRRHLLERAEACTRCPIVDVQDHARRRPSQVVEARRRDACGTAARRPQAAKPSTRAPGRHGSSSLKYEIPGEGSERHARRASSPRSGLGVALRGGPRRPVAPPIDAGDRLRAGRVPARRWPWHRPDAPPSSGHRGLLQEDAQDGAERSRAAGLANVRS